MEIGYRGEGAVGAAVAEGLRGLGVDPVPAADGPPTIVAGTPGDDRLGDVDDDAGRPWVAVEVGGIGGRPVEGVAGAVSVVDPAGPCYRCLRLRVAAVGRPLAEAEPRREVAARYAGAVAGRLVREVGPDGLGSLGGRARLLDGDEHRFLAVPTCRCAPDRDRPERPPRAAPPGGTALERAETAVDPLTGVIPTVGEQASYPAPYYVAELADTTGFSDARAARFAAGVDLDWDDAFMRAIGEGLERYCAGVYRLDALPAEPPGEAVELSAVPTATGDATPIGRWWPADDLATDDRVWLPAEAVVFPPPEGAAIDGITTGLGLGGSWAAAVLAGVLEVIERDACMLGWYSTFEPLGLTVDHAPYLTLARRMAGEGLASTALVMTQDIDVPVVTAVVHRRDGDGDPVLAVPHTDPDDWPAFAVGSAAAVDPAYAAERALAEAAQNWVELRGMGPERASEEGAIGTFASFPRTARSLVDPDHAVDAADLAPGGELDAEDALDRCVAALGAADLAVYAARTTTRDVAALGFEAARVVVPDAQPLVRRRAHFTDRVRTVPRSLGFRPRLDRGDHPYP